MKHDETWQNKETSSWIPYTKFIQMLDVIPSLKIRKWKDSDVIMMFKITYWLALRINETLKLTMDSFDLVLGICYLGKTKTEDNDQRLVPKIFIPELKEYLKDKSGALFPGMNYAIVYDWCKRLGKKLNILAFNTPTSVTKQKTVTHAMRKSRGKDMYYGTLSGIKADIGSVSARLGHKGNNRFAQTIDYLDLGKEGTRNYDEAEAEALSKEVD
uniref:ORF15 n=1 Tax=Nitrosopumilaceae spindle-shaped virus TaxID=3065433 RepID=A0AAT9J9D4_9VIRU